MANTPGVNITVTAAAASPRSNTPTATWFVVGSAAGVSGVAVPVNSMTDFVTYFGKYDAKGNQGRYTTSTVDSSLLYDALDVFFREGGINAYVSLFPRSGGSAAAATVNVGKVTLTAFGKGAWANSASGSAAGIILTTSLVSGSGSSAIMTATIAYNGVTMATSPSLGSETDLINWINSLPKYQSMLTASAYGAGTTAWGTAATTYLTGGVDGSGNDSTATSTSSLDVFSELFGPGQVSAPGLTDGTTYSNLTKHAMATNRVAVLDGALDASAPTLTTAVSTLQAVANVDPSYAAIYAPWLIVPAPVNTNPGAAVSVFNRTVAPSALAAAKFAVTDQANDCNVPSAGVGPGQSNYAVALSGTAFTAVERASLNAGGVNVIRNVPNVNVIAIYGSRSCALDQNWVYFNNCRFRMQITRDFDIIAESFVFDEIDGRGQIFARLNGAIAGQCQAYWTRKSIYGAFPSDAFQVNTGTTINTPATIAAGQINAQVNLRLAPFGEFVNVQVTKYLASAALPNYTNTPLI
jgi:hypothetical protein